MKKTIELIIFDLDGVLIDSIGVMQQAFNYAYAEVVGVGTPPFDEYRKHLGKGFLDIMNIMKLPATMHYPFILRSNELMQEVKIYSGVPDMLSRLKEEGIPLGIATGKDGKRARKVLEAIGLLHYFGLVIGSDEVVYPKPHPEMLERHQRHFKVNPNNTLFIGDSVADMRAGKAAKVKVGAALWGYGSTHELFAENPDYPFYKPVNIIELIMPKLATA